MRRRCMPHNSSLAETLKLKPRFLDAKAQQPLHGAVGLGSQLGWHLKSSTWLEAATVWAPSTTPTAPTTTGSGRRT